MKLTLASNYYQSLGRLPDFFKQIKDALPPEQLTQKLLKDWGFLSSNDRALIPLLKTLGFLTGDGRPTERYQSYRDHSNSEKVLGEAIKEAYADIFLIKQHPSASDKDAIQGKFKSYHNTSDLVSGHMTKTFLALLDLADISSEKPPSIPHMASEVANKPKDETSPTNPAGFVNGLVPGLHYNIQIHLPATKDVEVYNAIFKSIREHLIE